MGAVGWLSRPEKQQNAAWCEGEALFLSRQARRVLQVGPGASDPSTMRVHGSSKAVGSVPSGCRFPTPGLSVNYRFQVAIGFSLTRASEPVATRCCPLGDNRLGMLCTSLKDTAHVPEFGQLSFGGLLGESLSNIVGGGGRQEKTITEQWLWFLDVDRK